MSHDFFFLGSDNNPMVITNKLMEVFPKLQEGGISKNCCTCSRNLALLPCPNTGYTLAYLKRSINDNWTDYNLHMSTC